MNRVASFFLSPFNPLLFIIHLAFSLSIFKFARCSTEYEFVIPVLFSSAATLFFFLLLFFFFFFPYGLLSLICVSLRALAPNLASG